MRRIEFKYGRCATIDDIRHLAENISPMEIAHLDPERRRTLRGELQYAAMNCRTYTVRLDGHLAGICFIRDLPDRREMAFTKTRYLTENRKITFARGITQLLNDLSGGETAAGRAGKPMYMHTPHGDSRSKEWFVKAGCVETENGLLCP
jgi:hypothetical protein